MSRAGNSVIWATCVLASCWAAPGVAEERDVAAEVLAAERGRIAAIQRASSTAVAIFSNDGNGGGSGVVVTPDGYALSNFHVTAPVGNYMKCGMADGRLYDAVIVGVDPTGDVALIKLFGRDDFPVAEMGDSDQVRSGDWCFAVGNPFLLATDFQPTVTYGIVSGVHRYQPPAGSLLEYTDCIQTDASINPGNSGGPLFNAEGQLIGVNGRGSFEKRGRVNVGLGYAISINQIKNFFGHLQSGRIVDHATLGATVSSDARGRVTVSNILTSSDAYRRGLRYGDEVVSFGGRSIGSVNSFKNVLGIYPKGWRVPLSFLREGVRHEIHVRLAGVHTRQELLAKVQRGVPGVPPRPQPRPRGDEPRQPREGGQEEVPNQPSPHQQEAPELPEEIAESIKTRTGYANYYFNELQRSRVWSAFRANGDFSGPDATWQLAFTTNDGKKGLFQLRDEASSASWGNSSGELSVDQDLAEQLTPAGSGGLLAAMHLWRRLLAVGPEQFGQVDYLGTAPLPGQEALFDVLSATYNVVELRLFFERTSGRLVALEMFPDVDVDPCEIYFDDYRELGGRMWPYRMLIRHGDQLFAEIELQAIDVAPAAKVEA